MTALSIVIITRNEAGIIAGCIIASRLITDDIIVIDNGSTDETVNIAEAYGCRVYHDNWEGYGANKNRGAGLAKYDWILSIDADEVPDRELVNSLHCLRLNNAGTAYDIKFKSYFGEKMIRFGNWGRDHHVRLFNRTVAKWSEHQVHETLVFSKQVRIERLGGCLHHYSVKDACECNRKAVYYAKLSAERYFQAGKKTNRLRLYGSPVLGFVKSYILLLGFLDGKQGWHISKAIFKNKWLKYYYLGHMEHRCKKDLLKNTLVAEY